MFTPDPTIKIRNSERSLNRAAIQNKLIKKITAQKGFRCTVCVPIAK